MKDYKIRTKMLAGLAVVFTALLCLGVYTRSQFQSIDSAARRITDDSLPGIYTISQLKILTQARSVCIREHISSNSLTEMSRLEADNRQLIAKIQKLIDDYERTIHVPKDREMFAAMLRERENYSRITEEIIRISGSPNQKRQALELFHGKLTDSYQRLATAQDSLISFNKELGDSGAADILSTVDKASTGLLIGIVVAIFAALTKTSLITIAITKPMSELVMQLEAVSSGDLTGKLQPAMLERQDEFGSIARSMQAMSRNLRSIISEIDVSTRKLVDSSAELLANSEEMSAGSMRASERAQSVAAAAEEMSANVTSVAAGMEQTTTNLASVASATEQMTTTVSEISSNSEKARQITQAARLQAQKITEQMKTLGAAAREIGKVTETINEISSQTNLLALNATIEAARAGAAGKGFAVVANEIKALAQQTASATEDIRARIEGVQNSTTVGIQEIDKVGGVIFEVSEIVSVIAAAIEEQAASTRNISQNISEASIGVGEANGRVAESSQVSGEIARDIIAVRQVATEISEGSQSVSSSASSLGDLAGQLKRSVAQFQL